MFLFDYIVNLAIFSLLVSIPFVIRSFINLKPLKHPLWGGFYAGIVSVILVLLAVKQQGYVYDIRYSPVILMFEKMFTISLLKSLKRLYARINWMISSLANEKTITSYLRSELLHA